MIARLCRFVPFLFCLRRGVLCLSIVASTFLLSIEFNSDSFGLRTIIIKENYNVPAHAGEHRKYIDRRPIAPCRFYIYIASLLNRHGISCNPCHAVKARHCLVCHAAPRVMVPDSRGCGSVRVKRRNTPCLGDCQENTTLSGGDQPPSPRKSSGLVDDCRLRPACYAYPLVKVALSRDIDRRTVYRIIFRYPLSNLRTAYSGTPPVIGTCSECRVSAAGYLPRKRKITS